MPPRSRNHRDPTGPDTPHAIAASSLVTPSAILDQNARSTSRRIGGRPGDRIAGLPVRVTIQPAGRPTPHLLFEVLRRPVEFALVLAALTVSLGVGAWLHWSITDPSSDQTETQSEWGHVLAFSALVLALAAVPAALGRALSGARSVRGLAATLIVAGVFAAVTNIVEDGLGVDWVFVVFGLLTGVLLLALIGLATALGLVVRGARRLLALAPLATAIGVVTYVYAGGPILLCTWCAAAVYLLLSPQFPVGPLGQQASTSRRRDRPPPRLQQGIREDVPF